MTYGVAASAGRSMANDAAPMAIAWDGGILGPTMAGSSVIVTLLGVSLLLSATSSRDVSMEILYLDLPDWTVAAL
jgi:hypothetical protein